ncbi:MAG: hypothetical protein GC153_08195 [Alphaproteobacteria bacterium]|nr:hypothetical protein [Alphaproteobacteria bacterium]
MRRLSFRHAIRRNIAEVEPLLENQPPRAVAFLEKTSDLALAFAYFISVAYYINLFAAFALKGVGSRVMQSIFLPAMAIAFAAPAVAGQNFGAGEKERVRATYRACIAISSIVMISLTLLRHIRPDMLVNTWPALLSTATRIATFAGPAIWLSRQPHFELEHVWRLSVAPSRRKRC